MICIATKAAAAESNLSSLTQKVVANTLQLQLTTLDNLETDEYTHKFICV